MSASHTPGPWLCTKAKHGVDADHYVIASVADDRGDRCLIIHAEVGDDGQGDANARLIAAAPELLEALEKRAQVEAAYAQLALSDADPDTRECLLQQIEEAEDEAKDVARAAIAKAKGGQQ